MQYFEICKQTLKLKIGGGGGERVCRSANLAKNFLQIADLNNFSRSVDPINLMDSDFGKNRVQIMDSKHNSSWKLKHPLLFLQNIIYLVVFIA